ncbi:MFS transporter [Mesorhizobium humile]|uniref:MFS transporter n=1 Tax=Mesorhizobium humile TaxID=3072313 RepID=A0ABU4YIF9_9HYPH|nr:MULTISPECIES: MFS transporter [unclassified Mesorhizobium]MDX8457589.1 MFS transporter [Mesorhizobium sp. VK2D]MDX8485602.1 MFS transporter [Mesorhizobium sp. VK2B]
MNAIAEMITTGPKSAISDGLLAILAIAAGLTVANNYYNQAMLGLLASEFQLSAGTVSLLPVLTQLGNVAGILFLAPLGDRLERRSLILITMAVLVVALLVAAVAPSFAWLVIAGIGIGLFATVTQQIVPLAVHLASPSERGRVLGIVTGGILIGIVLARTISGIVSDLWGWQAVFWAASGLMITTAAVLTVTLPRVEPSTDLSYGRLLGSLWSLLRTHRVLRQAITVQALIFAAFIGFWSNLALVFAAPPYRFGATAVGLMALVGVAGALAAPLAGRFADRRGPDTTVTIGTGLVVLAFAIFGLFQGSLVAMIIGVLILDVAVQSSQVANQARVYALDPDARSRLNTIFMATMILGGAVGAGGGGLAYSAWGWSGTCIFGAASAGLALLMSRS